MPCQTPHLDETTSAVPSLSPGVVLDEEWLLRNIYDPDHVRNGKIHLTAVSLDDLKGRGFSVKRLQHVTQAFVEADMAETLERPFDGKPRSFVGISRLKVYEVRDIKVDDSQVFVVIDTALPHNRGHASIYLSNIAMSKGQARLMREKLLSMLSGPVSVSQAFVIDGDSSEQNVEM